VAAPITPSTAGIAGLIEKLSSFNITTIPGQIKGVRRHIRLMLSFFVWAWELLSISDERCRAKNVPNPFNFPRTDGLANRQQIFFRL